MTSDEFQQEVSEYEKILLGATASGSTPILVLEKLFENEFNEFLERPGWTEKEFLDANFNRFLKEVLGKAAEAITADSLHLLLADLANFCSELARRHIYFDSAVDLLRTILENKAVENKYPQLAEYAFQALLKGASSSNTTLADTSWMVLSRIREDFRSRSDLKDAAKKSDRRTALRIVRRFNMEEDLEKALAECSKKRERGGPRLIGVNSHKGGVGKSVVIYLLGAYLAAIKKKKVCIVDADVIGPSVHYYSKYPKDTKKIPGDTTFFTDDFLSIIGKLDDESSLIDSVAKYFCFHAVNQENVEEQRFNIIPGTILPADLDRFEERYKDCPRETIRNAMGFLFHKLKELFDYVLVDTSPGLLRWPWDMFLTIQTMGGATIFVMRDRPVDVATFAFEMDFIQRKYPSELSISVVMNDLLTMPKKDSFNDWLNGLSEELAKMPQTQAYYPVPQGTEDAVKVLITEANKVLKPIWEHFRDKLFPLEHDLNIHQATDYSIRKHNRFLIDVFLKEPQYFETAANILTSLGVKVNGE